MDGGHHVDLSYQHNHHPLPSSHHHYRNHRNDYIDVQPVISTNSNNRRNQRHSAYYSTSSSSSSASIRGCCCCLILLFSFLALLVLTVVLVIVLAVKPKKPQFDLEQVGVQYINLAAPVNTPSLQPRPPPPLCPSQYGCYSSPKTTTRWGSSTECPRLISCTVGFRWVGAPYPDFTNQLIVLGRSRRQLQWIG